MGDRGGVLRRPSSSIFRSSPSSVACMLCIVKSFSVSTVCSIVICSVSTRRCCDAFVSSSRSILTTCRCLASLSESESSRPVVVELAVTMGTLLLMLVLPAATLDTAFTEKACESCFSRAVTASSASVRSRFRRKHAFRSASSAAMLAAAEATALSCSCVSATTWASRFRHSCSRRFSRSEWSPAAPMTAGDDAPSLVVHAMRRFLMGEGVFRHGDGWCFGPPATGGDATRVVPLWMLLLLACCCCFVTAAALDGEEIAAAGCCCCGEDLNVCAM